MEELLQKIKDLIAKIVKVFKDLIAKLTGKGEEPAGDEETTGA